MKIVQGIVLFCLFALSTACAQQKTLAKIELKNPVNINRNSELIVLSRAQIKAKLKGLQPSEFIEIYGQGKQPITMQFDDLNADGVWDEAAFLYSFKPNETVHLKMKKTLTNKVVDAIKLAHVRMKYKNADNSFAPSVKYAKMPYQNPPTDFSKHSLPPYLTEGPGWENDKVAFRLYFDTRNGKDIYGKLVPGMVMDTVGANPHNSYHRLANWGMDILTVGKSLGAGSLAFAYMHNGRDTLVRLGGMNIKSETYQQIADGPVRAIFKMDYHWTLDGKPIEVLEYTSIWGGQYFYQSNVQVKGTIPKNLKVVMGIADFHQNIANHFYEQNAAVQYSYGKQSANNDQLGLAVFAPSKTLAGYSKLGNKKTASSDIVDTYLSEQYINQSKPAEFRFYACWEKTNPVFATQKGFESFLHNQAQAYSYPIIIK